MRHVLVAVFDSAIRTMLSEVLEVEGYHVTRARDQDQLIAVLRSVLHPLTVLLDVWTIEGGPSFSDEFLIALVTEHSRWERHAYIVTGGRAHFLTLHGGSSPMGSQASSLMSCLFQGCCFAPEGGAPAQVDVDSIAVWRGELETTTAGSGAHPVQDALLLLPVGTTYHGTGKQDSIGEVQAGRPNYSRTRERNRQCGEDMWLKPTHAYLPRLKPRSLRPA